MINTLKRQHNDIVAIFESIKKMDIKSAEAKTELRKVKTLIVDHLAIEDAKLYPALMECAKTDPSLNILVSGYMNEMKELSQFVIAFFDKYSDDAMSGIEFSRDYGKLLGSLQQRIRREESILYKEYESRIG